MKYVGIDVSKNELNLAIIGGPQHLKFPNTVAGRERLLNRLSELDEPVRVVVEATASYSEGIALACAAAKGVEVMVANPRATKHFAKALNQRGKTDKIDCIMLARFAQAMPFQTWVAPTEEARGLRRFMRRRLQLVRQQAAEKVRLIEMKTQVSPDGFILEDIAGNIKHIAGRIQAIEKRALELVRSDSALKAWHEQLCTIPGIANTTALAIIAELACLPTDMDARQLVAYAGLDPQPWQSGTMDAKRRISKRGNKRLRTTLYLAAWNATRLSPEVKAWRDRMVDGGKPPKVATIAVARKLLHAIEGMRRTSTDWDGAKFSGAGSFA